MYMYIILGPVPGGCLLLAPLKVKYISTCTCVAERRPTGGPIRVVIVFAVAKSDEVDKILVTG